MNIILLKMWNYRNSLDTTGNISEDSSLVYIPVWEKNTINTIGNQSRFLKHCNFSRKKYETKRHRAIIYVVLYEIIVNHREYCLIHINHVTAMVIMINIQMQSASFHASLHFILYNEGTTKTIANVRIINGQKYGLLSD